MDLELLHLLSERYPTERAAAQELARLEARLCLPKRTEHFLSDLHGEHEAFLHLLRSASGSLRRRIDELFPELPPAERRAFATLVYYPERKLPRLLERAPDGPAWLRETLGRLLRLCRAVAHKAPRSEVRSSLPPDAAGLLEELLYPSQATDPAYYERLLGSLIRAGQAPAMAGALAGLAQRFAISHLHVIGDVFDRGPGAHVILDRLLDYHSLDVQWGNHDIVWMGAAAGSEACMANVVRVSLRYANTETLENGYGVSLLPLASFAMDVYRDDPCEGFAPRGTDDRVQDAAIDAQEPLLLARMQKAISVIQFKLEGQVILRRPEFRMQDRLLLDKIDPDRGTVAIGGRDLELVDASFPTLIPDDPYRLSERERALVERLAHSFRSSERLQRHVRFLFARGGMYRVVDDLLLYHGCIPLEEDGSFSEIADDGRTFRGRASMDHWERRARQGYHATDPEERREGQDAMWYLWAGPRSPLFGKRKMATFERYFVRDERTHEEARNPYYDLRDDPDVIRRILAEFDLDPDAGRIVNGHVPVQVRKGQSPIKAGGRMLVIDGGLAKAYQEKTGIAGYTLISNSRGLLLAEHKPFESVERAIREDLDMESRTESIASYGRIVRVGDTDEGEAIRRRAERLEELLRAYRAGLLQER